MALLDFEGFDRETNLALSNWFSHGVGSGTVSADATGAFGYGRYCNVPYGNGRTIPNTQTLWFNAHLYIVSAPGGDWTYKFNDSGAQQFWVGFESDLRVKYVLPAGVVTMPGPVMALGAWYFIQIRMHIADSGGSIEFYVNGTLQHTYTGDTKITANAWINQWGISNAGTDRHDNILLYDETGAAPNAKTPETRVYAVLPTADGASSQWTPSAGANYTCVDEQPNDGDTSYVAVGTASNDDLYVADGGVAAGSTVYAVAVELDARKDDVGTNDLDSLVRTGGVTYAKGDTFGLSTSYQRWRSYWTTNPTTGLPWTVSEANAAEFGVRRTA